MHYFSGVLRIALLVLSPAPVLWGQPHCRVVRGGQQVERPVDAAESRCIAGNTERAILRCSGCTPPPLSGLVGFGFGWVPFGVMGSSYPPPYRTCLSLWMLAASWHDVRYSHTMRRRSAGVSSVEQSVDIIDKAVEQESRAKGTGEQ